MNYDQSIQYLLSLPRKNTENTLIEFKNQIEKDLNISLSQKKPYFFHVAGTNGKGSVVGYLQSLLIGQGYKVGTYQSPHVYDIRERILINGEMLSKDYFSELVDENKGKYDCWSKFLIAIALVCFLKEKCEVIVWETGIGGRSDFTNIIQHSTCCITSIGLDHVHLLGKTLKDIAWQKVGVLKPKSAVVVGYIPKEVTPLIQQEIIVSNANAWWLGKEIRQENNFVHYPTRSYKNLVSQDGPHQIENMMVAIGMLEIGGWIKDPSLVDLSLKKTFLKGRWEKKIVDGIECVFDGGHNKDAALSIVDYLKNLDNRWIILGSTSVEHDPNGFFSSFVSVVHKLYWVDLLDRAWIGKIPDFFEEKFKEISKAMKHVIEQAKKDDCKVLITGSFYLIGEVGKYLNNQS